MRAERFSRRVAIGGAVVLLIAGAAIAAGAYRRGYSEGGAVVAATDGRTAPPVRQSSAVGAPATGKTPGAAPGSSSPSRIHGTLAADIRDNTSLILQGRYLERARNTSPPLPSRQRPENDARYTDDPRRGDAGAVKEFYVDLEGK